VSRLHFGTLYREFLLRIIDLDLIAPQGDMSKLLGQFAAALIVVSLWLTPVVLGVAGSQSTPEFGLIASWVVEHFLIATTMLVVGLFAVLSWNSAFPDRRDVLILSPLPVPARTIFLAKAASVATALSLSIGALNLFTGLAAPFAFASAPVMPPPTYDRPLPPVTAADVKSVLDRDLQPALRPDGALAPGSPAGVSIGLIQRGERRVFTYGVAQPDSIYEIGSISKTFTGLILARMLVERKVRLDEPVRALLPDGIVAAPALPEITLGDLATHHSGLPGIPDNLNRNGYPNPGADYRPRDLYSYLAKRGFVKPENTAFRYSNLGFGLLGTALASRSGTTYDDLLASEITGPLGLSDTTLRLTPEQRKRLIQAFNYRGKAIPAWDLDVLAPAGAIRSTAVDMLNYLDAQLHPERLPADLGDAVRESHRLRAEAGPGLRIGLAWLFNTETSTYWHNGAISGYTSYAFFNPKGDYAGVVLYNQVKPSGFVQLLGQHLSQRLSGRPAIAVANLVVAPGGSLFGVLRSFFAYWMACLASGIFMFCSVLTLQGLAQLLPRQIFLRVSSLLQMFFFVALLTGYFWQAPFLGPDALADSQSMLFWIPSYWFFGLFQQLNGPAPTALALLIRRAWIGIALACAGATASYLICYFRTLKKIAEQPDILPDARRFHWLPPLGRGLQTPLGHFAIRTLLRSRQHRVILSFYLGIALGLAIFFSKAPALRETRPGADVWYHANASLLVATTLMIAAAVVGARVVFSIPLEIRANWTFRILPLPGVPQCLSAARRTIYFVAILPVGSALAVALLWLWPLRYALEHLAILLLLAAIIAELCLYSFRKIPFTCSYLPGKSYFHMAILAFAGLVLITIRGAALERAALDDPAQYAAILFVLAAGLALARWRTTREAHSEISALQFEDPPDPAVMSLGLSRDGIVPIDAGAQISQ
jgi:CubicO group peptidase (beta-lactamase class C family)